MSSIPLSSLKAEKINLLGFSPAKLCSFFDSIGEKKFRAAQVLKWIHQRYVDDFSQMSDISKELRNKLTEVAEIRPPEIVSFHQSTDGTCKWIVRVTGGSCIETVFIPEKNRGTLCVSSQVGCGLDCSFCATGKQGFQRNLTAAEIIGQLWLANKHFGVNDGRTISNVVLMGMGEPLLNFDNVIDAVTLMMDDNAYGLSKRRVTLSTSGVVPELDRLSKFTDVSLAVSLHATTDELRNKLVPINKKYPIKQLLNSVKGYLDDMPDKHRRVTIEYTLIDGINDSSQDAENLAVLLSDIPSKINLIPFNEFQGSGYKRVSKGALERFKYILIQKGFTVTVRTTRGDDIDAACGQLAGKVNDKTSRSFRYKAAISREMEGIVRFV